jgi:FlaA1/EpsC-like NDP-sugar epimerase
MLGAAIVESIEHRSNNGKEPAATAPLRREVPGWLRRHLKLLVLVDVIAAASATLLSQFMAFGLQHAELELRGVEIPYITAMAGVVPLWLVVLGTSGCYDLGPFGLPAGELRRVINAGAHFLAVMAVAYYIVHLEQLGRDFMIAIVPLATALTLAGRTAARWQLQVRRRRGYAIRRAVVLGSRPNVARLLAHLEHHPSGGIEPVAALVPDDGGPLQVNGAKLPVLGQPGDVLQVMSDTGADLLFITSNLAPGELRALTWALEGSGVEVLVAPTVAQLAGLLEVHPIAGLPLLYVDLTVSDSRPNHGAVVESNH